MQIALGGGEAEAITLPPLRNDVVLMDGPWRADGQPTYTLHDRIRGRFFRIGYPELQMLSYWHLGDAAKVAEAVSEKTVLSATEETVKTFLDFLTVNNLLRADGEEGLKRLMVQDKATDMPAWKKLLHHYLFFRVPLLRPDAFLTHTLCFIRPFLTRAFGYFMICLLLLGLYLVSREWHSFMGTFLYFFSIEGMVAYGLAIGFSKIVHEFGHAYAAKYHKCRVPTMGLAFMVMCPILYTDTSEVWKLVRSKERLFVALGGILAELSLAIFATLLWAFLPPGAARSAAFLLATVGWGMTLLVNLNPLMRFDGYYILSDLLAIENMQPRAFALARWRIRRFLFGFDDPCPETLPRGTRRLMFIYAVATWIYRFFLFFGIALTVYHLFFKLLGIFLMMIEIIMFILRPVVQEMRVWFKRRNEVRLIFLRGSIFLTFMAVGAAVLLVPWNDRIYVPASTRPLKSQWIYPPVPGKIASLPITEGAVLKKGDLMLSLQSPDLDFEAEQVQLNVGILEWEIAHAIGDDNLSRDRQVRLSQLSEAMTRQQSVKREKALLSLRAPFDGIVQQASKYAHKGRWVGLDETLFLFKETMGESLKVEAYVNEEGIARIDVGSEAVFYPSIPEIAPIKAEVTRLEPVSVARLETPYLASTFGGELPVRENRDRQLVPEEAVYRVWLKTGKLDNMLLEGRLLRGRLLLKGKKASLIDRLYRSVVAVFIREAGF